MLKESLVVFAKRGEKRGVASALRGCSLLAAQVGEPDNAIQLLGAAEVLQAEMGETLIPPEQREIDHHVEALRRALGQTRFAAAMKQGRELSADATVRLAFGPGCRPSRRPWR